MSVENLWGKIPNPDTTKVPVTILKQQATVLTDLTNGILEADVTTLHSGDPGRIGYDLDIIASALSNYRYNILSIFHSVALPYPVQVRGRKDNHVITCKDESEFVATLKEKLSAQETHQVIASLLAQSKVAA